MRTIAAGASGEHATGSNRSNGGLRPRRWRRDHAAELELSRLLDLADADREPDDGGYGAEGAPPKVGRRDRRASRET